MRVFLTGGTGFIGGEIARRLRARGHDVVALVRSPEKAQALRDIGAELVQGDLSDIGKLTAAMDGSDAAIHNAAIYEIGIKPADRPAMYEANVDGTENTLQATLDAGVGRVVYVSTINAFGNTHGRVVDETAGRVDPGYVSYYDETKFLAHQVALGFVAQGLPLVIVQPGQVYGPNDHSEIGTTITRFLKHQLPVMTFPDLGMNFVYRDDAAEGIVLALEKGKPGESYALGGQVGTMRDLIQTLAKVTGRRAPKRTLPVWMVKAGARMGPVVTKPMGFPPNLHEVITAAHGVTYWARDDKARRELGYTPRSLEQGIRDLLDARAASRR